jgi:predicted GNAT family acetyltransferase
MLWSSLRVLDARDAWEALAVCRRDPVSNVTVAALLEPVAGNRLSVLGGELWGWYEHGRLVSVCWSGANLVPVEANMAALDAYAARARRVGRRCSSIVGPARAVLALWDRLRPYWGPAREVRACQPLMVCDDAPLVAPDPRVRRTRPSEQPLVLPASVAMFTEEIGFSPVATDGGMAYRARVAELIAGGRSLIRVDDGPLGPEVVFKADFGAVSGEAVQVHGVWVAPHRRGEGLAAPAMASVVELGLAQAPVVSLYVNDFNVRAITAYRRVGFRRVGTFATVLF